MHYAIIQDETIVNVVDWDGVSYWNPPEGTTAEPIQGDEWLGWKRVNDAWTQQPEQQ